MAESTSESTEATEAEVDTDPDAESGPDDTRDETDEEPTTAVDEMSDAEDGSTDEADVGADVDIERSQAFSATIEAGRLETVINTLRAIVDECRVHLTTEDLRIAAVDPANVAMDDLSLAESGFESYQAAGGVLGVNIDRLGDIVSMANADELIQLELDSETRKLEIHVDSLEYTLALIDPESIRQEPDIPDFDLPVRVVLESDDLDRAVRAADMVSDHIRFTVDPDADAFHITASGDTDSVDFELDRDDLIEFDAAAADSLFSLDYLKDLSNSIPKNTEIELLLGEEFPMMMEYTFADGAAEVTRMLAPRIESE